MYELFGYPFAVIKIEKLIAAKRAAARQKDLIMLAELEAIQESLADRFEEDKQD